jgi:hypothetical protein
MTRTLLRSVALLGATVLLAACGSEEPSRGSGTSKPATEPESTQLVGQCPPDAPSVVSARTVATVDLDGDGKTEPVRLTAPDGDCANLLFAQQGDGYVFAQLPVGAPALSSAFGVAVPGREGALLATRQDHPRGGFQLRVYAAGPDGLVELEDKGEPLVPFAALDVMEHPLSIDCADNGLVVTEAVAHDPHGMVFAWDVRRTAYTLEGSQVTAGKTVEVADNVLPAKLRASYPDLVRHATFPSCRAS